MKINELNRAVLRIALPAIITNITTPILGLVDLAIVGHFGSAAFIGAIAVGSSLFNMIYWLLNFLRAGTSGLTAQTVGAGDKKGNSVILWRGVSIGALFGLATLFLSPFICRFLIPFMEADAVTSGLAEEYFSIVIWGAPAYITTYAISGWLLGNQDSVSTLWIALITNVTNIILSLSFVGVFQMKIEGVALGTCVSQWIGAISGFIIVRRKYAPEIPSLASIVDFKELKHFFSINIDIFLRTACLIAVTLWFTRSGAKMGETILATNSILMQLFMLFSFFMDGFAYAGEALAGKYYGAKEPDAIKKLIRALLKWGVALASAGIVIYFFAGELIVSFLTDDIHVRITARTYLPWAVSIPLCGFMAFIYDGVYIGMTLTRKMLITMACAMGVFFITFFLTRTSMGNHGLWLAFSLYLITRGVLQMAVLKVKTEF